MSHFFLACAVCVLGTSIGFNRPSWSRTYTTAARYRTALLIHAILYFVAFLGAYFVARKLFRISSAEAVTAETKVVLIWLAVLVVLILRSLSSWPRAWLHQTAGIPSYAHRLAALLADSELKPANEVIEEARATLLSRGVDVDADWLPLAQPTYQSLIKATTLFLQIRKWEQSRRFARFLREAKNDVNLLRRRFDRLSFRVSRSLASIERLGEVRHLYSARGKQLEAQPADELLRKIVADLLADSCEDIRTFHEDACLLAARATLVTQRSRKGRNALLHRLGFQLNGQLGTVGYGFLATTAVLLYVGMWLFFLILPASSRDIATRNLVLIISLNIFGALVISIVPKLRWGFANSGLHHRTPVAFVIGAGLCAVLFAAVVQLCAGAMLIGGWEGALTRLQGGSPYLPGLFIIASTMAWLVQDHRWQLASSPSVRRLLDGATFGAAWVITAILGTFLQAQIFAAPLDLARLFWSASGSFVFGTLIGLFTAECARHTEMRMPLLRSVTNFSNVTFAKPRSATA